MDRRDWVFKIEELLLVEVVVLLRRNVLLCPLPERHHRVERLVFGVRLILGLVRVFGFLLHPRLFHLELDRVADVVGVFLHQLLKLPRLQEARILLVLGVSLQRHDHVRTGALALGRLHRVPVRTGGGPLPRLVGSILLGDDCHGVGHHERRVEAHAELADDVDIVLLLHVLLELEASRLADRAEVVFQLVFVHADTVVAHGERPAGLVDLQLNCEITAAEADLFVRQRLICQLIDGVGSVRDNLTQEDLLMRIN